MTTWLEHVEKWKDCQLCPLSQQRSNICLARGSVPCDVLFVGEAPGQIEDGLGRPFKGPAGALLDQIIERSLPVGVTYALTNLVACYPAEAKARGDNEPELSEIKACRPRLYEFIDLCKPKLVVCVGTLASDNIGHDSYGNVRGAKCIAITHPAHILARLPAAQKQMATQRCIIQIRNAVQDMVEWIQKGNDNADS